MGRTVRVVRGMLLAAIAVLAGVSAAGAKDARTFEDYSPLELFSTFVSVGTVREVCATASPKGDSDAERTFRFNRSLAAGLMVAYASKSKPSAGDGEAFAFVRVLEAGIAADVRRKIEANGGCARFAAAAGDLFRTLSAVRIGPAIGAMAERYGLGRRE